jgi:hypothetical protein
MVTALILMHSINTAASLDSPMPFVITKKRHSSVRTQSTNCSLKYVQLLKQRLTSQNTGQQVDEKG